MRKIDLYCFIYNDAPMLPFFLDYYSFVDRITFIDSDSTDRTQAILKYYATPDRPILRITQTGLKIWDHDALHIYRNDIWRDSKYDLIFFPDCDEIFYRKDIVKYLNQKNPPDIYEMAGYEMVSNRAPEPGMSILSINTGVPFQQYNKSTIFNPKIDISFPNAHMRYSPCTNVDIGGIKLLHYRNLGLRMMRSRRDREADRLPIGCTYRTPLTDEEIKRRHTDLMRKATVII
jgi:hypothetical protein